MSPDDLDEVMRIEELSFSTPWSRAFFERELVNPVSFPYTERLRSGGRDRCAAYVVFWIVSGEGHILNLAVDPGLRRTGIAKRLLVFVLRFFIDRGVEEVFLEVRENNAAAISLYQGFGFETLFVRKRYYGDEDAIVMRRSLE